MNEGCDGQKQLNSRQKQPHHCQELACLHKLHNRNFHIDTQPISFPYSVESQLLDHHAQGARQGLAYSLKRNVIKMIIKAKRTYATV
jgi:hypothetical protein